MSSRFSNVNMGEKIEAFALVDAYVRDTNENKVPLVIGVYRDEEVKPWVLPSVKLAETELCRNEDNDYQYLHSMGDPKFLKAANELLLGKNHIAIKEDRVIGVQTISASGGIRLGAEFLSKILNYRTIYISNPSYANHARLFLHGGFTDSRKYSYWSAEKRGLDIEGFLKDLENAPENSVVLLHACAHNPTGCDPTEDQWKKIAEVMQKRKLFPFFDSAYQGFATGDLDKDAWSVRYFAENGFELFCVQTFSKNFGIYSERVGSLCIVLKDTKVIENIVSQFTHLAYAMYLNPPGYGARLVTHILNSPKLFSEWRKNMETMAKRIKDMRILLRERLEHHKAPGDWSHITDQMGMFSYTGLSFAQSEHMIYKHHIYMLRSGRISMCGLTKKNVEYVAKSICETLNAIKH